MSLALGFRIHRVAGAYDVAGEAAAIHDIARNQWIAGAHGIGEAHRVAAADVVDAATRVAGARGVGGGGVARTIAAAHDFGGYGVDSGATWGRRGAAPGWIWGRLEADLRPTWGRYGVDLGPLRVDLCFSPAMPRSSAYPLSRTRLTSDEFRWTVNSDVFRDFIRASVRRAVTASIMVMPRQRLGAVAPSQDCLHEFGLGRLGRSVLGSTPAVE